MLEWPPIDGLGLSFCVGCLGINHVIIARVIVRDGVVVYWILSVVSGLLGGVVFFKRITITRNLKYCEA